MPPYVDPQRPVGEPGRGYGPVPRSQRLPGRADEAAARLGDPAALVACSTPRSRPDRWPRYRTASASSRPRRCRWPASPRSGCYGPRAASPVGAAEVIHDVTAASGPYDLVLESTGGKNLPLAIDRLADSGALIWFGQASLEPATLSFFDILGRHGSVTIRTFAYYDCDTSGGDDLAVLVRLVAAGRLHPEIGRVADWADTAMAITDLQERRIRGNAVVIIPEEESA